LEEAAAFGFASFVCQKDIRTKLAFETFRPTFSALSSDAFIEPRSGQVDPRGRYSGALRGVSELNGPQRELDLKILVDELLTRLYPVTREMFYRRIQGFGGRKSGSRMEYRSMLRNRASVKRSNKLAKKLSLKTNVENPEERISKRF